MSSPPVRRSSAMRDWTSLPSEMLSRIVDHLSFRSDFVLFRSVCPSWRAAAPESGAPPQLPLLLVDPKRASETGDLKFCSLLTRKIHDVKISQSKGKLLCGPGFRYFLAVDSKSGQSSLFDPVTGDEISLPGYSSGNLDSFPIYNNDYVGSFVRYKDEITLDIRHRSEINCKRFEFCKLWSQGHTFYKGKYYIYESASLNAVDLTTGLGKYSYIHPHEAPSSDSEDFENDRLFGEGFIENEYGFYHGFDLNLDDLDDDLGEGFSYLIESSGDLLRVCRLYNKFEVYYLDLDRKKPGWVSKNSIGDAMLFLDSSTGISVSARDFPGFSGNCIYFMGKTDEFLYDEFTVYMFNLEDRSTEAVSESIENCGTWFMPSLF